MREKEAGRPAGDNSCACGEVTVSFAWLFCLLSGEMALTGEDVVTMLDSSFTGCDSSDDDLGMSIEEIENPHFDPDQGKQKS